MKTETEKPETKKCGESCGCHDEAKSTELKTAEQKILEKKSEEKLDPTHFGDWQIDCRAIDF